MEAKPFLHVLSGFSRLVIQYEIARRKGLLLGSPVFIHVKGKIRGS